MNLIDPRISIIDERLKSVKEIWAISSGKGGVGKSTLSTFISLILSKKGFKVGLLDLDLYGPTCHLILGVDNAKPLEDYGIKPVKVENIDFMSIVFFTENKPLTMRGKEITDTILEIFTITKWDPLDYLIIDTPPGMGEVFLELIRYIKKAKFLLVSTPSRLSMETVEKLIKILNGLNLPILGLIENMKSKKEDDYVKTKCENLSVKYLGYVPYSQNMDDFINNSKFFFESDLSVRMEEIISQLI
ncbi:MAG: ATP-binding protein [Dictyoglomus sp. NZ13-RE01]|nr:MAG: ATP-binding protein [Dictyoglomus sp. NZ13-RE01]